VTTGGEVCRVGLRAGWFVEAGPRVGRFVEAYISWVRDQVLVWCAWNSSSKCIMKLRSFTRLVACSLMCVVYEALGDTLRMDFVVTFLELWLRMVSLELWLRIEGKHVTFLELWLGMTSLELWLRMADGHVHSLSYGSNW